jgi:hypothetical protein
VCIQVPCVYLLSAASTVMRNNIYYTIRESGTHILDMGGPTVYSCRAETIANTKLSEFVFCHRKIQFDTEYHKTHSVASG